MSFILRDKTPATPTTPKGYFVKQERNGLINVAAFKKAKKFPTYAAADKVRAKTGEPEQWSIVEVGRNKPAMVVSEKPRPAKKSKSPLAILVEYARRGERRYIAHSDRRVEATYTKSPTIFGTMAYAASEAIKCNELHGTSFVAVAYGKR
jgi:hypothetical protein